MKLDFSFKGRVYSVSEGDDIVVHYGCVVIPLDVRVELRQAANTALAIHRGVVIDFDDYRD